MELLSPAGSELSLIAAVQSGADAVYLGGSKFSARHSAKNFSIEDMKRQIEYCHIRGTDVHVAANTLVKEKEINEFIDYIGEINDIGADALIIQDIGMASLVKKYFPDLPLHASTQMTAASLEAVRFLEKAGFSRVVLSRELSKEEIEYTVKNSNTEIEVFVHGALCMSYSGQCLMSSIIGGRSGNRGRCAQPCRLSYDMMCDNSVIKSGYLLSPKDNALLDELKSLEKIGVSSLKIEGRLKRPEYVAAVTGVYRDLINSMKEPTPDDWKVLNDAFNRSGFTKGYFSGNIGEKMMSTKTPGNVSDNVFSKEIIKRCKPNCNLKRIPIDIYVSLLKDKPIEITLIDDKFNSVNATGEILSQAADNKPLSADRLEEQIKKLGNTPFIAQDVNIELDEGITIPVSEINNVRRFAVKRLEDMRATVNPRRKVEIFEKENIARENFKKIISAEVRTKEQAEVVLKSNISLIYAPPQLAEMIKKENPDKKVITILPPIWKKRNDTDYYIADGVMVSNLGEIEKFKDENCYGGFRLNIFNNKSIEFFDGLKSVTISPELNLNEIKKLSGNIPLEAIAYGRLPLMVMENCITKAYSKCKKKVYLRDRKNEEFPLSCGVGCYSELLNSKPLYMADKFDDILNLPVSIYRLNFTVETKEECMMIINEYENAMSGKKSISDMKENTFTRGHYYRGVE